MRKRRLVSLYADLIVLILAAVATLLPQPENPGDMISQPDFGTAVAKAYCAAIKNGRPSGVPLNGITYAVRARIFAGRDIEVVFLRRDSTAVLYSQSAEEIQVVLKRVPLRVIAFYFGE